MAVKGRIDRDHITDGELDLLPVADLASYLAGLGRAYIVGSGRMSLAVAGNVRATITNPVNSGRNVLISKIVSFGTARSWADVRLNPTTGLPVSAPRPVVNAIFGQPGGVAQLRVDTDATTPLGGGTDTGLVIATGPEDRTPVELKPYLLIAPGVVAGINVPFAGAADAVLTAYFAEVDA